MKKIIVCMLILMMMISGCTKNVSEGVALLESKSYEEAKVSFQKDIEKKRNLSQAYHGLGIACFELGEYEDAKEAFLLAIEHEAKETAVTDSFLGACYMETKEYDKALDAYEKALAASDITEELKQEVQFNLIAVYENMGNWEAAKKQLEKYIKAYPDDARIEKEADFLETR